MRSSLQIYHPCWGVKGSTPRAAWPESSHCPAAGAVREKEGERESGGGQRGGEGRIHQDGGREREREMDRGGEGERERGKGLENPEPAIRPAVARGNVLNTFPPLELTCLVHPPKGRSQRWLRSHALGVQRRGSTECVRRFSKKCLIKCLEYLWMDLWIVGAQS